jgi:hypothetical protein
MLTTFHDRGSRAHLCTGLLGNGDAGDSDARHLALSSCTSLDRTRRARVSLWHIAREMPSMAAIGDRAL